MSVLQQRSPYCFPSKTFNVTLFLRIHSTSMFLNYHNHPDSLSLTLMFAAVQQTQPTSICRFFPECKKMDCPFYHPKVKTLHKSFFCTTQTDRFQIHSESDFFFFSLLLNYSRVALLRCVNEPGVPSTTRPQPCLQGTP